MSVKSTPSRAGYATANHLIALPDIGTAPTVESTPTVGSTSAVGARPTGGAGPMDGAGPTGATAHRPAGPDGHRCDCGRLRHLCVRDAVRAVWRIGRVRPARP